jgi:hypothetical protein
MQGWFGKGFGGGFFVFVTGKTAQNRLGTMVSCQMGRKGGALGEMEGGGLVERPLTRAFGATSPRKRGAR